MRFSCFCLALLLATAAHAQTKFQPGYIVPTAGDTIHGEVDLRDGRSSTLRCRFRTSPQTAVVSYAPAEVRAYGCPAQHLHYRALTVAVENEPAQLRFLEVLVNGPASLYFLRDEAGRDAYYVSSPSLPLTQLRHGYEIKQGNARIFAEEQTPFRNTLAKALVGCAPAMTRLPQLAYFESSLRSVVAQYNNCQAQPVAVADDPSATKFVFGLVGGLVRQQLTYSGIPYIADPQPTSTTSFAVGPTVRISSRRLSQNIALIASLLYEPEKFETLGIGSGGFTYSTGFDLAYLRLPLLVRYTLSTGRVAPLLEGGVSTAYALKSTTTYQQLGSYTGTLPAPRELLVGDSFRKLQFGLAVGAGVTFRAASGRNTALLVRSEFDTGCSAVSGLGTSVRHIYALLSIDLTK